MVRVVQRQPVRARLVLLHRREIERPVARPWTMYCVAPRAINTTKTAVKATARVAAAQAVPT